MVAVSVLVTHMGKLLQTTAKRKSGAGTKKSPNRATRTSTKKSAAKPTLRQLNRLLTQNSEQILQKAKQNSLRLIGREVL
jgi:hypothetical protein